jgi:hypothetical protein
MHLRLIVGQCSPQHSSLLQPPPAPRLLLQAVLWPCRRSVPSSLLAPWALSSSACPRRALRCNSCSTLHPALLSMRAAAKMLTLGCQSSQALWHLRVRVHRPRAQPLSRACHMAAASHSLRQLTSRHGMACRAACSLALRHAQRMSHLTVAFSTALQLSTPDACTLPMRKMQPRRMPRPTWRRAQREQRMPRADSITSMALETCGLQRREHDTPVLRATHSRLRRNVLQASQHVLRPHRSGAAAPMCMGAPTVVAAEWPAAPSDAKRMAWQTGPRLCTHDHAVARSVRLSQTCAAYPAASGQALTCPTFVSCTVAAAHDKRHAKALAFRRGSCG